jgi:hypothetical protein
MILNDTELTTTRERISRFEDILQQLRLTATREEFPLVSSSYRVELERMHSDVREYLGRHSSERIPVEAA